MKKTRSLPAQLLAYFLVMVSVSGCATIPKSPNLGAIYSKSASHLKVERNPVIVIPGILGSKLVEPESNQIVWGAFGGGYANPSTPEGARLIALPMDTDTPIQDIRDSIQPAGALDRFQLNLLFLNFRLNAYYQLLKSLGVGGYRDRDIYGSSEINYGQEHFTCFQFSYDLRLDLAANAKRFDLFVQETSAYVSRENEKRYGIKNKDITFDIVAHSMGGLLMRYYLRYGSKDLPADGSAPVVNWEGAKHVRRLIMVGTPNAGSLDALDNLVHGFKDIPFVPPYEPAVVGTMPALYQLLPLTRHRALVRKNDPEGEPLNIYDPALWVKMKWGLASPDQDRVLKMLLREVNNPNERYKIATHYQSRALRRAEKMWEALNIPAKKPEHLRVDLFAGDAVSTPSVMAVDMDTGKLEVIKKGPGDGTVLRTSALMDERIHDTGESRLVSSIDWDQVMFLFDDHLGLTKDPAFTDNILYLLSEQPERSADI